MSAPAVMPETFASTVREQYEDYPYPFVDIEKEGQEFSSCDCQTLVALSHAGWGGRRDLRHGTRILIAGCGTGYSTIQYAEELVGTDAEIVAIDLSAKSIEIAQTRMKKRGLDNVAFHHLSILDLPNANLGQFDIIESSGVLHHLPDPGAGLAALAKMLKDDGLMSLMVYGQYGRLSVYLVQELMKQLMTPETPRARKIDIAREFLNHVPNGHWLTVNNAMFLEDMNWPDGSGIYDLFLHSTDRAYTVPQLYEWVEGQDLILTAFTGDMTDDSLYNPESYNGSPLLREITAAKTLRERHAIAELMNGNIAKHFFYVAKQPKTPAQFADDMVMAYGPLQQLFVGDIVGPLLKALPNFQLGQRLQIKSRPFQDSPDLFLTKTLYLEQLLPLIDGKRSIGTIIAQVARQTGGAAADVRYCLELLYTEYRSRQVVFLRHESISPYRTGPDIIARVQAFQKRK